MNDILYAVEDQQQHQPLPAPSSSRNQLITSLSQVSHNQVLVEEYSHPYNTHTTTAQSQQQAQAAPLAVAQAAADVQLDHLLGPESQADVDEIFRCFTAADALEVFEEFAYGVPETLQDTAAEEAGYQDVPSSLKAVAPADESPKGVNATLDPSIFDKFPRTTSLISLSPSPDQIHSAKTSSAETSPQPYSHYHHHLTAAPIVSDVDSNDSSFADPSSYAFAPPGGPTLSNGGTNSYNLDVMDDLTSAAAAIEQQAALGADGGAASAAPAAASRGKGIPKKNAKKSAANNTASTSVEGRFKPFHEEKWDQKLTELIEFRSANGHTLVPHTYGPNPQLARWVKRQRRQYKLMQNGKTSTMTPERVAILEGAGFVWDSHEVSWREKVQELAQYRKKHGDCLVPSSYRDNPQLATWVKCQRRQYKLYWEGKPSGMNPSRIEQLDRIGFCWEIRPNNEHVYGTPGGPAGGVSTTVAAPSAPAPAASSPRKRSAGGGSGGSRPAKRGRKAAKRDSLSLLGEAASLM